MTETRIRFTKASLEAIPLPAKGSRFHWDDKTRGLAVRVTMGGARTFYVYRKVNGKPEQIRIGPFPDLTVEQARKKAADINGAIAQGHDLAEERRAMKKDCTFGELFAWWLEDHAKVHRDSWSEDQDVYRRYLTSLANVRSSKFTEADLCPLHADLGAKVGRRTANKALELVRAVFNRAIALDLIKASNPALAVKMFEMQIRERRLMDSEMAAFFLALEGEPNEDIRDYILLSLFTGARQANVLAMQWQEIDVRAGVWEIPKTKNGRSIVIPLQSAEIEIVNRRRERHGASSWVFPSKGRTGHLIEPKGGWRRILKRAGLTDLRIQDLRRTLESYMADDGTSLLEIGKALGHRSQAATAIYARLCLNPVREAKRAAHGAMHAAVLAGNIVPLVASSEFLARRKTARR